MKKLNVLVVDDEQGYRDEISEYLSDCGFSVNSAEKPSQALAMVASQAVDIAILDLKLPEMNGIDLMKKLLETDPEIAVIIISGHGDMDSVIEAMREGAIDFFAKPFDLIDIQYAIQRTQKYLGLQKQIGSIRKTYEDLLCSQQADGSRVMIGNSDSFRHILHLMKQVAASKNTDVLISGESGTGKELVARGIHNLSERKYCIFFDVNCTAVPENLFESEFFGHARHAFTGADASHKGWFEMANGGTLFLDEIGDMPAAMQGKLLRVLEERQIRPVGSAQKIPLDLRIIASTNRDLPELVKTNHFRQDLFYRLNKFNIHIPPLRERTEDIIPLLDHYNHQFSLAMKKPLKPISEKTQQTLRNYRFPGNVRELKNLVEKAVILANPADKYLKIKQLNSSFDCHDHKLKLADSDVLSLNQLEEMEKELIRCALQKAKNNKTRAAELLQITRTSLNRKIKKHNLI
ncbi:MAG: hypothetical protein APR54_11575 [Candidatus Cloacimonas sp. SDB]|nr:MAG: hypothetical protein APR54_11575 [Candidatus Cloacimonas sp. SDB]